MTDEEKKAIEYFKENINYFQKQIKFIETVDCDYYDEEYELYKNRVKQFNTVLNLIQTQQAELEYKEKIIEYWKNGFERELERNRENVIEIIKKDKIIDKMAFLIASKISSKAVVCNNMNCDKGIAIECKDCIIKYFEKKVREENDWKNRTFKYF